MKPLILAFAFVSAFAPLARAQSLLREGPPSNRPAPPAPGEIAGAPAAAVPLGAPGVDSELSRVSMVYVQPPEPKKFRIHDQIQILIDESLRASADQSLDTKKEYDIQAALNEFPSLRNLLEAQIRNGDSANVASLDVSSSGEFKGSGNYERTDRLVSRIKAEVIDVKPNGVLVLEARKTVQKDDEVQTLLVSGSCTSEDITIQNTVQSSQLADMTLIVRNEGRVKEAGSKGLIPRALEFLFAF